MLISVHCFTYISHRGLRTQRALTFRCTDSIVAPSTSVSPGEWEPWLREKRVAAGVILGSLLLRPGWLCVCVWGAQEGLSLQGVGLESHNLLFRPSFILVS